MKTFSLHISIILFAITFRTFTFLNAQTAGFVQRLAKLESVDTPGVLNPVLKPIMKEFYRIAPEPVAHAVNESASSLKEMSELYLQGTALNQIIAAFTCLNYHIAQKIDKDLDKSLWAPQLLACELMGTGEKKTTLNQAIAEKNVKLVNALLKAGANPNKYAKSKEKYPIIEATLNGNVDIVKLLLAGGADPNLPDPNSGYVALTYARKPEVIEQLVKFKANVNFRDKKGLTPLDRRDYKNKRDIPAIKALKQAGGLHAFELERK